MQNLKWIFVFIVSVLLCSSLSAEPLATLLLKVNSKDKNTLLKIESLIAKSTNEAEVLQGSYLLATSNSKKLKQHPAIYAEYVIYNDKELTDDKKLQFYRIAGDGFFDLGHFETSKKWHSMIVNFKSSTPGQKEYSTYKLAWAEINLKQPLKSFNILKKWLKENKENPLRESMVFDLGRSLGEHTFNEKSSQTPQSKQSVSLSFLDSKEISQFSKGLIRSAKRKKATLSSVYNLVKIMKPSALVWREIISSSDFVEQPKCFMIPLYEKNYQNPWISDEVVQKITECSKDLIKSKVTSAEPFLILNDLLSLNKVNDPWLLAKIKNRSGDNKQACSLMLSRSGKMSLPWISDTVELCHVQGLYQEVFLTFILNKMDKLLPWSDYLVNKTTLPLSIKSTVVASEIKKRPENSESILSSFLSQLNQEKRVIELEAHCPVVTEKCRKLWTDNVKLAHWPNIVKKDFFNSVIDNNVNEYKVAVLEDNIAQKNWNLIMSKSKKTWPQIRANTKYLTQFTIDNFSQDNNEAQLQLIKKIPNEIDRNFLLMMTSRDKNSELLKSKSPLLKIAEVDLKIITAVKGDGADAPSSEESLMKSIVSLKKEVSKINKHRFTFYVLKKMAIDNVNTKLNFYITKINEVIESSKEAKVWLSVKKEVNAWKL